MTVRHERGERGAITLAVSVLAVGFLILGGLVIDGGRQMNGTARARAVAEEAARAGASQTNLSVADPELVIENVTIAVNDYCTQAQQNDPTITSCEYTGTGEYAGGGVGDRKFPWVEVTVTVSNDTLLLGLIGVGSTESTVSARANAVEGVIDPLADPGLQTLEPTVEYPTVTTKFPTATGTPTTYTPSTPSRYLATPDSPCEQPSMMDTASTFYCTWSTGTSKTRIPTTTTSTIKPPPKPPKPSTTVKPTITTSQVPTSTLATIETPRTPPYTPSPSW